MNKQQSIINTILLFPVRMLFLPIILILNVIDLRERRSFAYKTAMIILISLTLVPLWTFAYSGAVYLAMDKFGLIEEPINISGTGSMYPTFAKGTGNDPELLAKQIVDTPGMFRYPNGVVLFGKRFFSHTIEHGDIVVAENDVIRDINKRLYGTETGVVKRVIAVGGDTLEFRDGIVIINGVPQKEPYIARARSTFGGSFVRDCKSITIPVGKYFIMGDNRKASGDSRHDIGFIEDKDISYVIPFESQIGTLDTNWHNPADDLTESAKIMLNKEQFLTLVNNERNTAGVKPLTYSPALERSAVKRGEIALKYDDFSFEATKSGYSMQKSLNEAGYSNILYGEWAILGYYEASELMESVFEFPDGKQFILDTEYQDMGIGEVSGMLNGCPTHAVVIHFGGYRPPNYAREVIDSWNEALGQLLSVQSGWLSLTDQTSFYADHKEEIDRINELIQIRIQNIRPITERMNSNRWLTQDQQTYMQKDAAIAQEIQSLAKTLNNYRR